MAGRTKRATVIKSNKQKKCRADRSQSRNTMFFMRQTSAREEVPQKRKLNAWKDNFFL
jgi:hypothetical protein